MSNSLQVKEWRRKFKQRIVESFGGKCAICGYCKCNDVFHCHHLDPKEKQFGLSRITANPQKWITVVPELRKCILLCSNCHGEVHAGITSIPSNVQRFDEKFSIDNEKETSACLVCGKEIPIYRKTCSKNCAAKRSRKINWDIINLYDLWLIQKIPQITIALRLGCSGSAVRKRLKKLKLL